MRRQQSDILTHICCHIAGKLRDLHQHTQFDSLVDMEVDVVADVNENQLVDMGVGGDGDEDTIHLCYFRNTVY